MRRLALCYSTKINPTWKQAQSASLKLKKCFKASCYEKKKFSDMKRQRLISIAAVVRIDGVPEALAKKMLDALDDDLWYKLRDSKR